MKRWLAIALLACAVRGVLAQEEPAVDDFGDAMAAASATAAAMAVDSEPLSALAPLARLESGVASWYGGRFHGRKTANGERFDMDALTAAHPRLPFGSWVRVHNPVNGRSVDVRINDRGPHIRRRVIDLSRAAARALGVSGTHLVELWLLDQRR